MDIKKIYYKLLNLGNKIKFYLIEHSGNVLDVVILKLGFNDYSLRKENDAEKYLLFVGKEANFRILKFIKWLSYYKSYKIILVLHSASNKSTIDLSIVSSIVSFRNKSHLKNLLKNSNLKKMVAFTSSPIYAKIALEHFNGAKIFDPYDSFVVYYGLNPKQRWMKAEIPNEKICYQKAEWLLARNLEGAQSVKLYNLKRPPNIFFSDYCDNDNFYWNPKLAINTESKISLVYSGGLYGKSARASSHGIENFDELILALVPNKIHLHLYPNPTSPVSYYVDFIEEAKKNEYLHVHTSISQSQLGKALAEFTFGILPHFKDEDSQILDYKLKYGTSNKFFNFLEAGIPIIVSEEMTYMAWLVRRYEIGIVINRSDLKNLRQKIVAVDYLNIQNNVKTVREKLSMNKNLPRLLAFLERI